MCVCLCVPSVCIQALVHQCDSGEALINSSPTLGPPCTPVSSNTFTKTQMHESHISAAWARPPAGEGLTFISPRQRLCRVHLSSHPHVQPAHRETFLYYSCVFLFLNALTCAALVLRGVPVVSGGALPFAPRSGGREGQVTPSAVNLQSYVNTNTHAEARGKV